MSEINCSPLIGKDYPCFIVAEAGINHNGIMSDAGMMVKQAKEAGADAVKFQTFKGGEGINYPNLTYPETLQIKEYCDKVGIIFFSTPHSNTAIDFLSPIVPLFKIASTFLNKVLFIDKVLAQGKPTIISINEKHGHADISILEDYWKDRENPPMYLLHTVCEYPATDPMFVILEGRKEKYFVFDWGYSDHTKGIKNCVKAVKDFGACIIEKHFKIHDDCVDASHSVGKDEFKEMVDEIRKLEKPEDKAPATDRVEVVGKLSGKPNHGRKR